MAIQICADYDMRLERLTYGNLSYDTFQSEACHMYHFDGDFLFISKVMKANLITVLWNREKYAKALYILAMVDYVSWKNDVPLFSDYEQIRASKLKAPLFPAEVIMLDKIEESYNNRRIALETCKNDECGKFFFRHIL